MRRATISIQTVAINGGSVPLPIENHGSSVDARPVKLKVPADRADAWFRHFQAECSKRGWNSSGHSEMTASRNSGNITIKTLPTDPSPELVIDWRRQHGGPIQLTARPSGTPPLPVSDAKEFFDRVERRSHTQETQSYHCQGKLYYDGLPWRGELWLNEKLRLGPASLQYEEALVGPRVILVDAEVDGTDRHDANCVFELLLRELARFLTVVFRRLIETLDLQQVWTLEVCPDGKVVCSVRQIGYHEPNPSQSMPSKGTVPPVPLRAVQRPDFTSACVDCAFDQEQIPSDVSHLWHAFRALSEPARKQFLQASNAYWQSLSLGRDQQTLSLTLMVVACEALKPLGASYDGHNSPAVVNALLGEECAKHLYMNQPHPLGVRNAHVHRGEFKAREFTAIEFLSSWRDPSFDERRRMLDTIAPAAIIEWLSLGGIYTLPPKRHQDGHGRGWKFWIMLTAVVLASGLAGWFLHALRCN